MSLLLPCALLAALGVQVLLTASVLVAWELLDSLNLVWTQVCRLAAGASPRCGKVGRGQNNSCWTLPCVYATSCRVSIGPPPRACCPCVQLSMLVLNGVQPSELVVKRLAMLGCTGGWRAGPEEQIGGGGGVSVRWA